MSVQAIPKGYHTITPYMTVRDAARAIEFYKQAFGAKERGVMKGPEGKIMHAELVIGDSIIMLADEFPEFGSLSPQSTGGSGTGLHIYIEDVDSAFDRAVKAGDIVRAAQGADRKLITGISVFDVYEGAGIDPDKKSIAIAVTLQPREKTLTDQEIEAVSAKIVAEVGKRTGGALRG